MANKTVSLEISKYMSDLGKKGGSAGGRATAAKMSKKQLKARAKKAVAAREAKRKK